MPGMIFDELASMTPAEWDWLMANPPRVTATNPRTWAANSDRLRTAELEADSAACKPVLEGYIRQCLAETVDFPLSIDRPQDQETKPAMRNSITKLSTEQFRTHPGQVLDQVTLGGGAVEVHHSGSPTSSKPVAIVLPYEDYASLMKQREAAQLYARRILSDLSAG